MKKLLTIGGAMRDMFIVHEHAEMVHLHTAQTQRSFIALEEGRKIEIDGLEYSTGGGAVNSAASFLRLNFNVEAFFKIGDDVNGAVICDQLRAQGVVVDHVVRTAESATGVSIIIPCPSGDRSVFVCRGANLTLKSNELPGSAIADAELVYITSLSKHAGVLLPEIASMAKKGGALVATNPGTSQLTTQINFLESSLKNIDILMLNAFEATLLMQAMVQTEMTKKIAVTDDDTLPQLLRRPLGLESVCFTLQQFFHEIITRGPQIVVVTNGAEGVYVTDGAKIYFHPSVGAEVISTLGAGDAFNSTFVGYLAAGKSVDAAIRAGVCNAANVLQFLDAQAGLLSVDELEKRISQLDPALLRTFPL